jgi:hypothetical protein
VRLARVVRALPRLQLIDRIADEVSDAEAEWPFAASGQLPKCGIAHTAVIAAYEKKIADLENRKLILSEKLETEGKPRHAFDRPCDVIEGTPNDDNRLRSHLQGMLRNARPTNEAAAGRELFSCSVIERATTKIMVCVIPK